MLLDDYLNEQHVSFETMLHPPAYTAEHRAKFLHVPGKQVAKSVLLAGKNQYILAVLPATHQVDLDAVSRVLGGPCRLADGAELDQFFFDCERGALSPFGQFYGLQTILDEALNPDALIIFEAQRHALAIRMRCADFERLEKPLRFAFARRRTFVHNRAS